MSLPKVPLRQLDVGPAGWFQPTAAAPPSNQVVVSKGFLYAGGYKVYNKFTADQLTPGGFPSVTAGNIRWDLVYLDDTGTVQVANGTQVASGAPLYQGAPGYTAGPDLPDAAVPIAYVFIDETGTPIINDGDIRPITGFVHVGRSLRGHYVDKGATGLSPTGASTVVTALFSGETSGGTATTRGVVTSGADNVVEILDQNFKAIIHNLGFRVFGRLTFSASVWTLAYFYMNASGVETALTNIATQCTTVPTNMRLYRVPKVYSLHESGRPLFGEPLNTNRRHDRPVTPTAEVPVGGIIEFAPEASGTPPALPTGYEWCDGTTVATANSRKVGQPKPTRMKTAAGGSKRFQQGVDLTAGAYGGATAFTLGGVDTISGHSHTVNGHNHGGSGSIGGSTSNESGHTHGLPNTGDSVPDGAGPNTSYYGLANNLAGPTQMHHHTPTGGTTSNSGHNHNFSGVNFSLSNDSPGTDVQGGHDNKPLNVEVAVIMRVI